jgi:hypothetical protein
MDRNGKRGDKRGRGTLLIVGVVFVAALVLIALAGRDAAQAGGKDKRWVSMRNVVGMREIKTASDWNADPTAVPQFFHQVRERTGNKRRWRSFAEPIEMEDAEVFRWPMIYFTGHNGFEFTDKGRENFRRYILNGGLVWSDDCLPAQSAFMKDFKSEIKKIFPEYRLESIKKEDPRFTSMYSLFYKVEKEPGCIWAPAIDNLVMLVDGQLAVVVTMNDYGCAWEVSVPPTQDEPIGLGMHAWGGAQREAVYQFTTNLFYYILTH